MSINPRWRFTIDTFESNTRGSQKTMLSLSSYTYAALKAEESNPAIAAILLVYEPVFFAYRDLDQQYGVKSGEWEGTTLGFEEYLDQMPLKLREWESLIRAVYIEDSPEERAIFPDKRRPFESGTYASRLDALGSLKLKTDADPLLATANVQITSFYNAALGARLVQQMSEGSLKQLSDLRENQRVLLAGELTGVLGQVMFIYRHNLVEIEHYFDLSLLQNNGNDEQVIFNGPIAAVSILNLNPQIEAENLEFSPSTILRMTNTSPPGIPLIFYSASGAILPPGAGVQFTLQPGETIEKTAAEMNFANYPFFNIQNNNDSDGGWVVEVIQ